MLDEINRIVDNIIRKALIKGEREYSGATCQLLFTIDPEKNKVRYTLCRDYVRTRALTFLQVLGVIVDFKGYSLMAPPFIKKSIKRISQEREIDIKDISIMCLLADMEILPVNEDMEDVCDSIFTDPPERKLILCIYNGIKFVDSMPLEDLFQEIPSHEELAQEADNDDIN